MKRLETKAEWNSNGCLIWTGGKDKDGYGFIYINCKTYHAHRWLFEQVHGYLPEAVMHTCDTPACVNIEHLKGGTHTENMKDKVNKGRQSKGEIHGRAKLSWDQVNEIRERYAKGGISHQALALEYKISKVNVGDIIRRKIWID